MYALSGIKRYGEENAVVMAREWPCWPHVWTGVWSHGVWSATVMCLAYDKPLHDLNDNEINCYITPPMMMMMTTTTMIIITLIW